MSQAPSFHPIISVTGLGYVGLPLALAFARHHTVIAYDHAPDRVAMLQNHQDPSQQIPPESFRNLNILFTSHPEDLAQANFHIVATPTPINANRVPDISLLQEAMRSIGSILKKGDIVVIESTVYPGCSEEDCLPILEATSHLKCDVDFHLAYSPERINPGDDVHTLANVPKLVAARTLEALDVVAQTYASVVQAGIHRAPSIKVAEAAKILENTQRDINIALMNECSLIFSRMGISTLQVIEAAKTKWNFMPFHPGLVGGHCIGVDPYYLDFKARQLGYHTQVISQGRFVNEAMGRHVAKQTVKRLLLTKIPSIKQARVLVMGLTYKANVADVRSSRSVDIIDELRSFSVADIDVVDPLASKRDALALYGFAPADQPSGIYDAIIVATAHDCFVSLGQDFFNRYLRPHGVLSDVYGIFDHRISGFDYWSL